MMVENYSWFGGYIVLRFYSMDDIFVALGDTENYVLSK